MLYGDVTPDQRNKWLLGRTSRAYVDYFADDAPVAPASDEEDKAVLAGLLGLPVDPD